MPPPVREATVDDLDHEQRARARTALAAVGLSLEGDGDDDEDMDDETTVDADARIDHERDMVIKHNEAIVRENVQMITRAREAAPKICARILSRVDQELRLKMETDPAYREDDPTVVWNLLRTHALNDDVYTASPLRRIQDAKNAFHEFKQERGTPLAVFYREFEIQVARCELLGIEFASAAEASHIPVRDSAGRMRSLDQRKDTARDQNIAHLFLDKVHGGTYGDTITEWRRRLTDGVDEFPKTVEEAYNRLKDQKELSSKHSRGASARGVAFVRADHESEPKSDASTENDSGKARSQDRKTYRCNFCNKVDHLKKDCRFLKKALREHLSEPAFTGGTPEEGCNQQPNYTSHYCAPSAGNAFVPVNDWDVLCDNQSTVHIFKNKQLLRNIRRADHPITITGVGGAIEADSVVPS